MTLKQLQMYHIEARKAWLAWKRAGHSGTYDDFRALIHEQALGGPCSAKELNNKSLDKVLGVLWSWSRADDLGAQMDVLSQPARRCRFVADDLLDRISAILIERGRAHEAVERGAGRDGYLRYMAKRIGKLEHLVSLDDVAESLWCDVIAALMIRFHQVSKPPHHGGKKQGQASKRSRAGLEKRRRPYDTLSELPIGDQPMPEDYFG